MCLVPCPSVVHCVLSPGSYLLCRDRLLLLFWLSQLILPFSVEGLGWQWMSPHPDQFDEHNIWNPMLGPLCHAHIGVFMEALSDEEDFWRTALSCHLALDTLCDKK